MTMAQVKTGDTVTVHYTGTLNDGSEFDTSRGRDPLQFTVGSGEIIEGFEDIVIGMQVGETRKQLVSADKAYGPHHGEGVLEVEREMFPPHIEVEVGQVLALRGEDEGEQIPVTITKVTDTHVTLDQNHPLAGQDLTFEIEVIEIS